jgi:hypothetical protein
MGFSFLVEMINSLSKQDQYIIIADAGPVGTIACANYLHSLQLKFLLCVSGGKQIRDFQSHSRSLAKGYNFFKLCLLL